MASNYNSFANFYDILTANVDYTNMASFLDQIIKKYRKKEKNILLDLACGTGCMSEAMAKLGYDVIGTDLSPEMLNIAIDKKVENGLEIQYLLQDMRKLDMFGTIDVTICVLDSINHLNNIDDVRIVFNKVSLFSEPDGLFIFDVNTIYKHKKILSNNIFVFDTEKVYCVWDNFYNEKDHSVNITLDFFERNDNLYKRYSESFSETAYDIKELDNQLTECGFQVLHHYDGYSFNVPHAESERIVIVARKV